MNIAEYPKSTKKLKEFVKNQLVTFQNGLVDHLKLSGQEVDIPEIGDTEVKNYTELLLDNNPRILYDFFDKEGLMLLLDADEMHSWSWQIRHYKKKHLEVINYDNQFLTTRIQCELDGFESAFKTLEQWD